VIKNKKPCISHNILSDPCFNAWKKSIEMNECISAVALPLFVQEEFLGILNIFASEKDCFDAEEVKFLTDLANNLAYGIQSCVFGIYENLLKKPC